VIGAGPAPERRPFAEQRLPRATPLPAPACARVALGRALVLRRRVGWGRGPWCRDLQRVLVGRRGS
jgi:hypothetical protein